MPIFATRQFWLNRLFAGWFGSAVGAPFLLTRIAWVLAAAFARGSLAPNPTYLAYARQGGQLTRIFLVDIFAHWDAKFYLSIITDGYWPRAEVTQQYSNVAFYPLYPYLVKSIGWLGVSVPSGVYLGLGLLLSNVCFLASAALLYRLARRDLGMPDSAARRSLLLLILFPASFFFSSFYTESLFLLLSVAAFYFGLGRRWFWAGLMAALATLTRAPGLLVAAALVWLYLDQMGWRLRGLRANGLWLGLAPAALLAHFYLIYRVTGNFLAPVQAQWAWGRNFSGIVPGWLRQLDGPALDVFKIDAFLGVVFVALSLGMLLRTARHVGRVAAAQDGQGNAGDYSTPIGIHATPPAPIAFPRALALYSIGMCIFPLATGSLTSLSRLLLVIFPVFLWLGEVLEDHPRIEAVVRVLFFTLQILYFAAWANFYWVA